MNEIITIDYIPNGHMTIVLDGFFPASQTKFKKLLKVMENEVIYEDYEHNVAILERYFDEKLEKLERSETNYRKAFWKRHQEIADLTGMLESNKFPNGVKMADADWKYYQKVLLETKRCKKRCKIQFNKIERDIKRIKSNKETLKTAKKVMKVGLERKHTGL